MIKAIAFDVDNTLYDDRVYWLGAFNDISIYLEKSHQIKKEESYEVLVKLFDKKTSSYSKLFNDFIEMLGLGKFRIGHIFKGLPAFVYK